MNRNSADHRSGTRLLMLAVGLLGVAGALACLAELRRSKLDPVTGCAAGRSISGQVVVLLDVTDEFTVEQRGALRVRLHQLEQQVQPNTCVSLWALEDSPEGELRRVFRRCFPGRKVNTLLGNAEQKAALCDSFYTAPLDSALDRVISSPSSARSPLIPATRELSEQPELASQAPPRRLLLISDLMENGIGWSFYSARLDLEDVHAAADSAARYVDLSGVTVEVTYVTRARDGEARQAAAREFWRRYFVSAHAKSVRLERL